MPAFDARGKVGGCGGCGDPASVDGAPSLRYKTERICGRVGCPRFEGRGNIVDYRVTRKLLTGAREPRQAGGQDYVQLKGGKIK